jgi:hypothetical protein
MKHTLPLSVLAFTLLACNAVTTAQPSEPTSQPTDEPRRGPGGPGGPDFRGGPGGGFGPPTERKVLKEYDKDKDGRLNADERKAAREGLKTTGGARRGPGGPGGPGGFRPPGMGEDEKPTPGVHVEKADVKPAKGDLYDDTVLRTIFLDFEAPDWEDELSDFIKTDVEIPATLTVDGKAYSNVGVSFRGASSLMMVGKGSKRSLNISADCADPKQRVLGAKTLNLLNSHEDASFMRTVVYLGIAKAMHIPAPKANFVRVVINGENWGIFTNAQQFNKDMLAEVLPETKGNGARWKVPGSPMGRGGLEYLGDDVDKYKQRYEIKTKDDDRSWSALVALCKTLNETPPEQLEAALTPVLDIDGVLRFLALENTLVNSDGYWTRASDYSIFLDERSVFHILPHDANETLSPGMGPGGPGMRGRGRPGGGPGGPEDRDQRPARPEEDRDGNRPPPPRPEADGPNQPGGPGGPGGPGPGAQRRGGGPIDPLIGLDDSSKPLRSKLLQVPSLRARYLTYVRDIAEQWLDWNTLGPVVARHRALIDAEIKTDTKKLSSYDAFLQATSPDAAPAEQPGGRRPGRNLSLKQFAEQRRAYLLSYPEIQGLPKADRR